jgi:hypothetical protein
METTAGKQRNSIAPVIFFVIFLAITVLATVISRG